MIERVHGDAPSAQLNEELIGSRQDGLLELPRAIDVLMRGAP